MESALQIFENEFFQDIPGLHLASGFYFPPRRQDSRTMEKRASRKLATHLLEKLGIFNFTLEADENGAPIWPKGVVGSITHKAPFCQVACAFETQRRWLGIDTEMISSPKLERTWNHIASPKEQNLLLQHLPQDLAFSVLFSAKEALYKAIYPIIKEKFWFDAVEARDAKPGQLTFEFVKSISDKQPQEFMTCRYETSGKFVHTVVADF